MPPAASHSTAALRTNEVVSFGNRNRGCQRSRPRGLMVVRLGGRKLGTQLANDPFGPPRGRGQVSPLRRYTPLGKRPPEQTKRIKVEQLPCERQGKNRPQRQTRQCRDVHFAVVWAKAAFEVINAAHVEN